MRITLQDTPLTRRGILFTITHPIYDPLGFVAPVLLVGKQLLQELCREGTDWDDPVPDQIRIRWEKWRSELCLPNEFKVRRCFKPNDFGPVQSTELHHFSDASTSGYGQCSYIRLANVHGEVHCELVMAKSRVCPLKTITIPSLELTAALVSVRVSTMLHKELDYNKIVDVYWTDSKVVLGYLNNEARRFHVFVANRVQQIRDETSPEQWRYVEGKENPADEASRGLTTREFLDSERWLSGPSFLHNPKLEPLNSVEHPLSQDDPEVKTTVLATQTSIENFSTIPERLEYFSEWHRAKRAISAIIRWQQRTKNVNQDDKNYSRTNVPQYRRSNVEELRQAELAIVRAVQEKSFSKEIQLLRNFKEKSSTDRNHVRQRKTVMKKTSSLFRLDPFLDNEGILRVGGRLSRSSIPLHVKHPAILPRKGHVTALVIKHYHQRIRHQGRGMTLNELRANGFWIVGGSSTVVRYISD